MTAVSHKRYIYIDVAIDFYWLQWRGLATFIYVCVRRKFWRSMISGDLAGLIIKAGGPWENWKHERAGLAGLLRSRGKRARRSCSHNLRYVHLTSFAAARRLNGSDFARLQPPNNRHDLCKRVGASPWPHSPPKLIIFPVKSRTKFFLKFQNILAPQSHGGQCVWCDSWQMILAAATDTVTYDQSVTTKELDRIRAGPYLVI